MARLRRGRNAVLVASISAGWGLVVLARAPAVTAVMKSRDGFSPNEHDPRVLVEDGAEGMATAVSAFLEEAIGVVEEAQGRPFKKPFRVYVCATQKSLNEFVGLPPGAPIRGTVRFGEVYLAPSAFDWHGEDLHRESLLHELSHLHLRQHLGFLATRGRVPSWFQEGLADIVSGAGGEGIADEVAARAILNGPALQPDSTGRLWSLERVQDSGLGGPMFHKQSRMFVAFLRDRDPHAFHAFLLQLQEDKRFARPFREQMGKGVEEMWLEFGASLGSE